MIVRIVCRTRTRQASQRRSNVRVVFVYTHLNMVNLIPFTKRFGNPTTTTKHHNNKKGVTLQE